MLGCAQRVCAQGQGSLPQALVVVTDKGKSAKEQGNLVVKEAVSAMLQAWDAPFRWPLSTCTSRSFRVTLCMRCTTVQSGHCCRSSLGYLFQCSPVQRTMGHAMNIAPLVDVSGVGG